MLPSFNIILRKIFFYCLAVAVIAGSTACTRSNKHMDTREITKTELKPTASPAKNEISIIKKSPDMPDGIVPTQLSIPSLHINAIIEPVSITDSGQMDVPASADRVGLLSNGIMPGEIGNAVLDGHVDSRTGPAVFFRLKNIKKDDIVTIKNNEGCRIDFIVESVEVFKTADAPISRIFGINPNSRLNLITCTGKYSRKQKEHLERLVVFTKRLSDKKICDIKP